VPGRNSDVTDSESSTFILEQRENQELTEISKKLSFILTAIENLTDTIKQSNEKQNTTENVNPTLQKKLMFFQFLLQVFKPNRNKIRLLLTTKKKARELQRMKLCALNQQWLECGNINYTNERKRFGQKQRMKDLRQIRRMAIRWQFSISKTFSTKKYSK